MEGLLCAVPCNIIVLHLIVTCVTTFFEETAVRFFGRVFGSPHGFRHLIPGKPVNVSQLQDLSHKAIVNAVDVPA